MKNKKGLTEIGKNCVWMLLFLDLLALGLSIWNKDVVMIIGSIAMGLLLICGLNNQNDSN